MEKSKVNLTKSIFTILIAILLCFSSFVFSGCGNEANSIDLVVPFKTSYSIGDNIDVSNGTIKYYFYNEDGKISSREILISSAYKVTDSTKDRIEITGFNSSTADKLQMTLKFTPANIETSISLDISYKVYGSSGAVAGAEQTIKILNTINTVLRYILAPLVAVACSLGMIFVIFLAVKMARANNSEQREEAKKRVVYTVIGIAIGIALIIIFNLFASFSNVWFADGEFFHL